MVKRCTECYFYESTGHGYVCRRLPPQIVQSGGMLYGRWPLLGPGDWCGEWKDKHMAPGETPQAVLKTRRKRAVGKLQS